MEKTPFIPGLLSHQAGNILFRGKRGKDTSANILLGSILDHQIQDRHIRIAHSIPAHTADIPDSLLIVAGNDTLSKLELASTAGHLVPQHTSLYRGRDLGGAGRFCTVTDNSTGGSHRIDDGSTNYIIIRTLQICNATGSRCTGRNRAAVG